MSDCKRQSAFRSRHISLLDQELNNPRARQDEQFGLTKGKICMNAKSRMQSSITHGIRLMSLSLLSVMLITTSSAQLSSKTPKQQMSKKEVKALLSSAKTAKDHQALATYFAQQAQTFEKKSHIYEAKCVMVAEYPSHYQTKYPSEYDYCRFWTQYYALKSKTAENAARLQEQLANSLADGKQ
jgi:hypothetical protein